MKKFAIATAAYLLPLAAFASTVTTSANNDNIADIINQLNNVINTIIPFLVGLAVLIIIWGVFNYIAGAGDEEKRAQAKQYIVWGVVGVFIMLSIWGLVNVLVNSFDLRKSPLDSGQLPSFSQPTRNNDLTPGAGNPSVR
ncbi:MAG: pilin [bacterium]|nr:pilin [bacterium]